MSIAVNNTQVVVVLLVAVVLVLSSQSVVNATAPTSINTNRRCIFGIGCNSIGESRRQRLDDGNSILRSCYHPPPVTTATKQIHSSAYICTPLHSSAHPVPGRLKSNFVLRKEHAHQNRRLTQLSFDLPSISQQKQQRQQCKFYKYLCNNNRYSYKSIASSANMNICHDDDAMAECTTDATTTSSYRYKDVKTWSDAVFVIKDETKKTCSGSDNDFPSLRECIMPPTLSYDQHKGSHGRVVIIGGCTRYSGAPYYAAMSALRTGCDLVTVLPTTTAATIPIKCYSPELMVESLLTDNDYKTIDELTSTNDNDDNPVLSNFLQTKARNICETHLQRVHCVVVGPGLGGRNDDGILYELVSYIIKNVMAQNIYMILDADALFLLTQPKYRTLINGYRRVILTPNVMEQRRFEPQDSTTTNQSGMTNECIHTDVTILNKGKTDEISINSCVQQKCTETGGPKRPGGIGDVLAGTIGAFVAWHCMRQQQNNTNDDSDTEQELLTLSVWMSCCVARRATKSAFLKNHRSMSANDVIAEIGSVLYDMEKEIE